MPELLVTELTKASQILSLRMRGTSIDEIATQLDTNPVYVRRIISEQMAEAKAQIIQYREEILAFDIIRMDSLIDGLMPAGLKGDLKVIDRLVKLFKAKATHLQVAEPKRVKVEGEINHTIEPVFTVNSEDYTRVLEHLQRRPELLDGEAQFEEVKEKIEMLYRNTGTEEIDEIVEGIFKDDNLGEEDE